MTMSSPEGMRIPPQLPAAAMKTYSVSAPLATHWVDATCEDIDCEAWQFGWQTVIDESTDLGQRQAHYIRKQCGRKFTEGRREDGLTEFAFDGGQPCFAKHRRKSDRPELYTVRGGDWRGDPRREGVIRRHTRPEEWVEDFGLHQQKLADRMEQG